jgi:chemotaxis receptor (MCP) glutamine deamidase CheD
VIHIGGLYASGQPAVIETVLGSCVSACLFDPVHKIGGMNHIFLAESCQGDPFLARYGVHAMELLIARIERLGGERKHLKAKVFGAASVLRMNEERFSVPRKNEKFVREFLEAREIPLVGEHLGGHRPLKVRMFADTGRVLVKALATNHLDRVLAREGRATAALAERWQWFDKAEELLKTAEPTV